MNTPSDWHIRYRQQAGWTASLRGYLYPLVGLESARRVLEVGCGTGAVLADLQSDTGLHDEQQSLPRDVHGLDIDPAYLELANRNAAGAHLVRGDAHHLPYGASAFDICLCHFLLLWVAQPAHVLSEMARVTRPGGAVLALAEPDYGGRIDYPDSLAPLGQQQMMALQGQGANPLIGRRLAGLFHQAGLTRIQTGVLGGQWSTPPSPQDWETEWAALEWDLVQNTPALKALGALRALKEADRAAWRQGERVLFIPTFYACGWVTP